MYDVKKFEYIWSRHTNTWHLQIIDFGFARSFEEGQAGWFWNPISGISVLPSKHGHQPGIHGWQSTWHGSESVDQSSNFRGLQFLKTKVGAPATYTVHFSLPLVSPDSFKPWAKAIFCFSTNSGREVHWGRACVDFKIFKTSSHHVAS